MCMYGWVWGLSLSICLCGCLCLEGHTQTSDGLFISDLKKLRNCSIGFVSQTLLRFYIRRHWAHNPSPALVLFVHCFSHTQWFSHHFNFCSSLLPPSVLHSLFHPASISLLFHPLVLPVFSCNDPLDGSGQEASKYPRNNEDEGKVRPAAGDCLLEELLCKAVGHQPATAKAWCQANPEDPAALQVSLCERLLQTGPGNTGTRTLTSRIVSLLTDWRASHCCNITSQKVGKY